MTDSLPAPPRIAFFALGGTIASVTAAGKDGASPALSGADLLQSAPGLAGRARVDPVQFMQAPSVEIALDDLLRLRDAIQAAITAGADAVVITQGTDTLEESAFALDLLHTGSVPVVVTGAMRTASQAGNDGPANLEAAVVTALTPAARGCGVLVVFNDAIHAARFVRKTHTTSPATFQSAQSGQIGWISEGAAIIVTTPVPKPYVELASNTPIPAVALLKLAIGDDGRMLQGIADLGFAGLVLEGFGGGHVPTAMVSLLADLARTMPVVLASRTGAGLVLARTYSFPGSEIALRELGLIGAGMLDGPKARVLLSLCIAAGLEVDAIAEAFVVHGT